MANRGWDTGQRQSPALASESKPYSTNYPDVLAEYAFAASGRHPRRPLVYRFREPWQVRWRRLRRVAVCSPGWGYLLLGSVAGLMVGVLQLVTTNFVNATTYFAAAGLIVGGYSAWVLSKQNQANFIKDYISKFLEKKEVYESWRYLFYSYQNSAFEQIDETITTAEGRQRAAGARPIVLSFALIATFNEDRDSSKGLRRWHPQLLPGSLEEGRIDEVLSYFNLLGDYYERGSIDLDEIGDVATFYLRSIGNCEAFRAYLSLIMTVFHPEGQSAAVEAEKSAVRLRYGYPPFGNLCLLLNDLEELRDGKEKLFYGRCDRFRRELAARTASPSEESKTQGSSP